MYGPSPIQTLQSASVIHATVFPQVVKMFFAKAYRNGRVTSVVAGDLSSGLELILPLPLNGRDVETACPGVTHAAVDLLIFIPLKN